MAVNSYDLISEKYDIVRYIEEHGNEPPYQQKLKGLQGHYCAVRWICADGSCFYRGLGFAFLESLLGKTQDLLRLRERVIQSRYDLLAAGFPEHVFEHNYDTVSLTQQDSLSMYLDITTTQLVDMAENDGSVHDLLKAFNHHEVSDSAVRYLRLITSAFLRSRADFYQPFIEDAKHIEDFCAQNVEPMTSVCDHIQIAALTQALDIPLKLEYVDSMDSAINEHIFPEGSSPCVYMLYKQNHYTLLYRKEEM